MAEKKPLILLVEDEQMIIDLYRLRFDEENYEVLVTDKGSEALALADKKKPDIILLDIILPEIDGFGILRELKRLNKSDGVIIISAKETLETKIEGFTLGADDYLTKPFHLSELLVRIQALVRRKQFNGSNIVKFNEIEIDTINKTVKVKGTKIDFTKTEMDLLLFLIGNKNKVLSKGAIAEHLSGDMADMLDNHDFIYAHIKNLKKKLKEMGTFDYLKSVYGTGYKWEDE